MSSADYYHDRRIRCNKACLVNRNPRHWQGLDSSPPNEQNDGRHEIQSDEDGDLPYRDFQEHGDKAYLPRRDLLDNGDHVHLPQEGLQEKGDRVNLTNKDLKEDSDKQHGIYKREVSNVSNLDPVGVTTRHEFYKPRAKRANVNNQGQNQNPNSYDVKTACMNPTTETIDECLESVDKKIAESCVPGISKLMDMMNQPGKMKPGPYQIHANESETCIRHIFSNCSYDSKVQVKTKMRKIIGINLDVAFQEEFEMDACSPEECAEDLTPNIENCLKEKRSNGKHKELCGIQKGNISTEILQYVGECIEDHMSYSCIMQSKEVFEKSTRGLLDLMQSEALSILTACDCENDGQFPYNHTRLCLRWIDSSRLESCADTLYEYIKFLIAKKYNEPLFQKTHACFADALKVCPSDTVEMLVKIIAGALEGNEGKEPEPSATGNENSLRPAEKTPTARNPCSNEEMEQFYEKIRRCARETCPEGSKEEDRVMDVITSCVSKNKPTECRPHKASEFISILVNIDKIIYDVGLPTKETSPERKPSPDRRPSPVQENSPDRRPSPDQETSPGKKPSPDRETSPDRKPSPDRETSPDRRPSPDRETSPERRPSPDRETSPEKRPSPDKETSPGSKLRKCLEDITDARMKNCLAKLFLYVVSYAHAHYTEEARASLLDKAKLCFQVTLQNCPFESFIAKLLPLYATVNKFHLPQLQSPDIITRVTVKGGYVWCATTVVSTHHPVTTETFTRTPSEVFEIEEITPTTLKTSQFTAPRRIVTKWYPSPSTLIIEQTPQPREQTDIIYPTTTEIVSVPLQTRTERKTFPTERTEVHTFIPPTVIETEQKTPTTILRQTVTPPGVTRRFFRPLPRTSYEERTPPTESREERLTPTTIRTYRPTWLTRYRTHFVTVPTPKIVKFTPTEKEEFHETRTRATTRRERYTYPTRMEFYTRPTAGTEIKIRTPKTRGYEQALPATTIKYIIQEGQPKVVPVPKTIVTTQILEIIPDVTSQEQEVTGTPVSTERYIPTTFIEVTCWNHTVINFWIYENEEFVDSITIPYSSTEIIFTPDEDWEVEEIAPTRVIEEIVTPPKEVTEFYPFPGKPIDIPPVIVYHEIEYFTQASKEPEKFTFPCETESESDTPFTSEGFTQVMKTFTTAFGEKEFETTHHTKRFTPTGRQYTETQKPSTMKFAVVEFEYELFTQAEEEIECEDFTYHTEEYHPTPGSYTERETPSTTDTAKITFSPVTAVEVRPTPPTEIIWQTVTGTQYQDAKTKTTLERYTQTIPHHVREDFIPTEEEECEYERTCKEPPEAGPCTSNTERWYYDPKDGSCRTFVYGGCEGNGNRYSSESECLDNCGRCRQEPEKGPCSDCVEMWYFSPKERTCRTFTYGGCEGNSNRYPTEDECMENCLETVPEPITTVRTKRFTPQLVERTDTLTETTVGYERVEFPEKEQEGGSEVPTTVEFEIKEDEEKIEVITPTPVFIEKVIPQDMTEEIPPVPATRFTIRPTHFTFIRTPAPKEIITYPIPQAPSYLTYPGVTTRRITYIPKKKGRTYDVDSFSRSTVSLLSRTIPTEKYEQSIKSPTTMKIRVIENPVWDSIATATDYKFEPRTYPPERVTFLEEITPETPVDEENVPIPEYTVEEEHPIPTTTIATVPAFTEPDIEELPRKTTRTVTETEKPIFVDLSKPRPVTSIVERHPQSSSMQESFTKSTIRTPRWTPASLVEEDSLSQTTIRFIIRELTEKVEVAEGPAPTTETYERVPRPTEEEDILLPTTIVPKTVTPPIITYSRDKEVTTVSYVIKEDEILEDKEIDVIERPYKKRETNIIPKATTKHYTFRPPYPSVFTDMFPTPEIEYFTVAEIVKEQYKTPPPTMRERRTFPTQMQTQEVPWSTESIMIMPETKGYECVYPTTEKPEVCGLVKKPCKPSFMKKWILKIRKCVESKLEQIGRGLWEFVEGKISYDQLEVVVVECVRQVGDTRCRNNTFPLVEWVFDREFHIIDDLKDDALKNPDAASEYHSDLKHCVALINEEKLEDCFPGLYKIFSDVVLYRIMDIRLEMPKSQPTDCLVDALEHCDLPTRKALEKELQIVLGKCIKFTKRGEDGHCDEESLKQIDEDQECNEEDFESFMEKIKSCFDSMTGPKKQEKGSVSALSAIQILTKCRAKNDPPSHCLVSNKETVGMLFGYLDDILEEAAEEDLIKGNLLPRFSGCFTGILDIIFSMEEYDIYAKYIKQAAKDCLKPAVKGYPPGTDKIITDFYLTVLEDHVSFDDGGDQGGFTTVSSVKRTRRGIIICANQLIERLREKVDRPDFGDDCVAVGTDCDDYQEDTQYVLLKSCNRGQVKQWIKMIEECVVSKATSIGLRNPDYLSFKQIVIMLLDCIDRSGPLKCRPKVFEDFHKIVKMTVNIIRQNTISGEEKCKKELKEDNIPKKCYRTLHRYLALRKDCSEAPPVKSLNCLKSSFKSCPENVANDMLKSLELAMLVDEESLQTHQGEFKTCTPEQQEVKEPPVHFRSAASDLACGPGGVLIRKSRAVSLDSQIFQASLGKVINSDMPAKLGAADGGKACTPTEYKHYFEEIKRCGERRLKLKFRRTRHECHKNDFIESWNAMTECMIENIGLELTCRVKTEDQIGEFLQHVSKALHVGRLNVQKACPKVQRCYGSDEPVLYKCSAYYLRLFNNFQTKDSTDLYLLQILKRVSKLLSCLRSLYPDCSFDTLVPSLSFVYLPLGKNYDSGIKTGLNFTYCEKHGTRENLTFPACMDKVQNTTEDLSQSFAPNCSGCVRVKEGICSSDNITETIQMADEDYSRIVPCLKNYITNEQCLYFVTERIKNYCLPQYHGFIKSIKNGIVLNSIQYFWKFNQCLVDFKGDCPEDLRQFASELFYDMFGMNPTLKSLLQAFRDSVI